MFALHDQISLLVQGSLLTNMEYALAVEAYNKLDSSRNQYPGQNATSIARDLVGASTSTSTFSSAAHHGGDRGGDGGMRMPNNNSNDTISKFNFDSGAVNFEDIMCDSSSCTPRGMGYGSSQQSHSQSSTRQPSFGSLYGAPTDSKFPFSNGSSEKSQVPSGCITRTGTFGSNYGGSNNHLPLTRDNTIGSIHSATGSQRFPVTMESSSYNYSNHNHNNNHNNDNSSLSRAGLSVMGDYPVFSCAASFNPPTNPLSRAGTTTDFYAPPMNTARRDESNVFMGMGGGPGLREHPNSPRDRDASHTSVSRDASGSPNTVFSPTQMRSYISETIENKSMSALDLLVNTVMYISADADSEQQQVGAGAGAGAAPCSFSSTHGTLPKLNMPTNDLGFDPYTITVPIGGNLQTRNSTQGSSSNSSTSMGQIGVKRMNSADSNCSR